MSEKDPERITRSDIGSWISGPPQQSQYNFPGERLGRPQRGPASVARWGVRIVALLIDWAIAMGLAWIFFRGDSWGNLAFFVVLQILMVGFFGYSIGHRIMGMQVQKMTGKPVNYLDALVRALLVALIIPPFLQDPDQRGLHDRLRGTILVMIR
ncbi:RDD family protein [Galactobacter caseinivorans]|uniref:RDD family protein n=1 Tax=Galactobacter caseinivorans TaxID=2676123 RepID=A0A496PMN7_9MICC|nr:RDD family protein [Galactobacter caseinivorans]RKW71684.1 RDD family protein [Galactobacter caseinivorans]